MSFTDNFSATRFGNEPRLITVDEANAIADETIEAQEIRDVGLRWEERIDEHRVMVDMDTAFSTYNKPSGEGMTGAVGPNGIGYAIHCGRKAAAEIQQMLGFVCQDYMPIEHLNRKVNREHPLLTSFSEAVNSLVKALAELAYFDRFNCRFANLEHDEKLFEVKWEYLELP